VGTSVFGIGREQDLANWSATTAAAFETARAFNDAMMPINETGLIQRTRKDAAYTEISNWIFSYSEGRDRSKHSGSQYASKQSSARWHGIFFATSERSMDEFADIAQITRVDGEYARCIDVPVMPKDCETIFDRFDTVSKRKATVAWARGELKRLRKACENNRGAAAHAFIRSLPGSWDKHRSFIEGKVNEFVGAVNGNQLSDVKHHAAQNFGIIYAGACMAINKNILPWDPKYLLESLQTCFLDAMGCVTIPDDPILAAEAKLVAGQARLREALQDSGKWPTDSKCTDNDIGFVKREGDRKRYVADTHSFRKLFDDEKQARIVVKWLHGKGLLKVSHGAKESLDAAIWHGTSPKWPNGEPYRSYEFYSPFGSKTKKTCVT